MEPHTRVNEKISGSRGLTKGGQPMDEILQPNGVLPNERWRNKKNGNIYTVVEVGRHSETLEWMVAYRNPEGMLWLRPYELFLIKFEKEQKTYFA
jgi:hypothetical protein